MKKLNMILATALVALTSSVAYADPVEPGAVILGNDGRFNAAPGICLLFFPDAVGECVTFIQENVVSPPACDGHLRSDSLECGANTESP